MSVPAGLPLQSTLKDTRPWRVGGSHAAAMNSLSAVGSALMKEVEDEDEEEEEESGGAVARHTLAAVTSLSRLPMGWWD